METAEWAYDVVYGAELAYKNRAEQDQSKWNYIYWEASDCNSAEPELYNDHDDDSRNYTVSQKMRHPIVTMISRQMSTDFQNSFTAGKSVKFETKHCITLPTTRDYAAGKKFN